MTSYQRREPVDATLMFPPGHSRSYATRPAGTALVQTCLQRPAVQPYRLNVPSMGDLTIQPYPRPMRTQVGLERQSGTSGFSKAVGEWTDAARPILLETARTYQGLITYRDLAARVQVTSGVRTRVLMWHVWGRVLDGVACDCRAHAEPLLSSLCIQASGRVGDGRVGDGFERAVADAYGETLCTYDVELRAAEERLACYRHFGAKLPPDGGAPTLPGSLVARRKRLQHLSQRARDQNYCVRCHLAVRPWGPCASVWCSVRDAE